MQLASLMNMKVCRSQPKPNQLSNGIFQKKSRRLRTYFFKKTLEFLGLSLYPWKFRRKQSFTPENSTKFCYTSWKFQRQKPRLVEIPHEFFLSPLEIPLLFYLTAGISTCSFFIQYPWKFHVLNPPSCLDFFWDSPITELCLRYSVKNTIEACVPS